MRHRGPLRRLRAGRSAGPREPVRERAHAGPRRNNLSESEARSRIARVDKNRASYYRYFTDENWGMARNYDLCLNSGDLDGPGAVSVIRSFIEARK